MINPPNQTLSKMKILNKDVMMAEVKIIPKMKPAFFI